MTFGGVHVLWVRYPGTRVNGTRGTVPGTLKFCFLIPCFTAKKHLERNGWWRGVPCRLSFSFFHERLCTCIPSLAWFNLISCEEEEEEPYLRVKCMYVCTLSCWSLFVPLYPTYRTCFKEFRPPVFLRNRYLWHRLKTQEQISSTAEPIQTLHVKLLSQ